MSNWRQEVLTIGVFIIIVAIVIIAGAATLVTWQETIPLIIGFYGCWLIVAAAMRSRNPSKYARSAFSLFGWGIILASIGFGLDLNLRGMNWIYTIAVVLLLWGILAIVVALKPSRKKA